MIQRVEGTGGVPRQRCIIRIHGISLIILLERLPPTQTKGIPGFQSKTPVAQMHCASELPLSEGDHSINMDGLMMIAQANPGSTRKRMGKLLYPFKGCQMVPTMIILSGGSKEAVQGSSVRIPMQV